MHPFKFHSVSWAGDSANHLSVLPAGCLGGFAHRGARGSSEGWTMGKGLLPISVRIITAAFSHWWPQLVLVAKVGFSLPFSPTFSESLCPFRDTSKCQMMCPPQNLNPSPLGSLIQDLEAPAPGQQCPFLKLQVLITSTSSFCYCSLRWQLLLGATIFMILQYVLFAFLVL